WTPLLSLLPLPIPQWPGVLSDPAGSILVFQDGPDGHERWSWRRAPPLPRFPVRRGGNPFPVLLVLCSLKWPVAVATTCSNSISPFPNDRRLVHIFLQYT